MNYGLILKICCAPLWDGYILYDLPGQLRLFWLSSTASPYVVRGHQGPRQLLRDLKKQVYFSFPPFVGHGNIVVVR